VAGILIENAVKGSNLFSSVIGIGMNVNQMFFNSNAPNPVSFQQITGKNYDISELLKKLLKPLNYWYGELENNEAEKINETYFSRLYRSNEWSLFAEPGRRPFEARITGIGSFGQLQLQLRDNTFREYLFKEVEFVL
jgi:BirA family biotin operon repressor/biotin-[acetyl-CoA-carboxylase] ligase